MKTRAELYGQEATDLLRIISMYPGLSELQLCRFYSDKKEIVQTLLSHLKRQGRILQNTSGRYFAQGNAPPAPDSELCQAVWVLLDFIDRAEFHSVSDFPVKIIFFVSGELYEIISVAVGQETLITHALLQNKEHCGRRILLVEAPEQISRLEIPSVSGYCTVDSAGKVNYYKKETGGL